MSLLPRCVAPAGAPIAVSDLTRWVVAGFSGKSASDQLCEAMEERWGHGYFFLSCTGRAGMTLLLRAMRDLRPSRNEVVVPSYTCYSVPAAAVKAGLRVRLVDINPETLDYDRTQLSAVDFRQVLAVIATNLYGLPNDLPALSRLAKEVGAYVIDDAAQAMGAAVDGRLSGTWGDAGLFSFDKGKGVSSIDGGVVYTRSDELADALRRQWSGLKPSSAATTTTALIKILGYALMLRPTLYGLPARAPFLGLGKTVFTTEFPTQTPSAPLSVLGAVMLKRLDTFTASRVKNARAWEQTLGSLESVQMFTPRADAKPAYVRFPLLVNEPLERDAVLSALNAGGIGATASYPASLADVPELRTSLAVPPLPTPGGRLVADRIVTLPTHPYVAMSDITRSGKILNQMARARRSAVGPEPRVVRIG